MNNPLHLSTTKTENDLPNNPNMKFNNNDEHGNKLPQFVLAAGNEVPHQFSQGTSPNWFSQAHSFPQQYTDAISHSGVASGIDVMPYYVNYDNVIQNMTMLSAHRVIHRNDNPFVPSSLTCTSPYYTPLPHYPFPILPLANSSNSSAFEISNQTRNRRIPSIDKSANNNWTPSSDNSCYHNHVDKTKLTDEYEINTKPSPINIPSSVSSFVANDSVKNNKSKPNCEIHSSSTHHRNDTKTEINEGADDTATSQAQESSDSSSMTEVYSVGKTQVGSSGYSRSSAQKQSVMSDEHIADTQRMVSDDLVKNELTNNDLKPSEHKQGSDEGSNRKYLERRTIKLRTLKHNDRKVGVIDQLNLLKNRLQTDARESTGNTNGNECPTSSSESSDLGGVYTHSENNSPISKRLRLRRNVVNVRTREEEADITEEEEYKMKSRTKMEDYLDCFDQLLSDDDEFEYGQQLNNNNSLYSDVIVVD